MLHLSFMFQSALASSAMTEVFISLSSPGIKVDQERLLLHPDAISNFSSPYLAFSCRVQTWSGYIQ